MSKRTPDNCGHAKRVEGRIGFKPDIYPNGLCQGYGGADSDEPCDTCKDCKCCEMGYAQLAAQEGGRQDG